MCGIAGFIGSGNKHILEKMISCVAYRGPDERRVWLGNNVGLPHARLSIVDLTPTGSQPMSNSAGTITLVFNGEIYNFTELRERLLKTGKYVFRGTSDTEVVIYLYEEMGEAAFAELNGMFAIALYDAREQKLILPRDRMGKKPLYYIHRLHQHDPASREVVVSLDNTHRAAGEGISLWSRGDEGGDQSIRKK